MAKSDQPRIAILGAGPIGLEAALYARSLNLPVTVFEQGRIGEYWQRWGPVRLFSPFGMNTSALGRETIRQANPQHAFPADNACITGREHLRCYLEPLAKSELVRSCLRLETQVVQISRRGFLKEDDPGNASRGRQPFLLLIREGKPPERIEEADIILDCTGTYGTHRWLGEGGMVAPGELTAQGAIAYGLEDVLGERRAVYAGKNILVVGGGYSAATTICNLATLAESAPDTWVIWLARTSSTQPIPRIANDPFRERDRLAVRANTLATRGEGNIEFHNQACIVSVEALGPDKGFRVGTRCAGKSRSWDVDRLIANVGYSPDPWLYRELQIQESYATLGPLNLANVLLKHRGSDGLDGSLGGPAALVNPEPGFFILGAKSFGRDARFLLRHGFEQIPDVFALITGRSEVNLYRSRERGVRQ
jgi:thioredoxin reductase